jgi:hypothetical protein
MNTIRTLSALLLLGVCSSCATTNLARWGWDETSVIDEPHGEVSRSFLKPGATVIGMPIAVAWDIATFPFQLVFGVYPYGNWFMSPHAQDGED